MNATMAPRGRKPGHVRVALVLLWAAWLASVGAWIVHCFEAGGLDADLYSGAGLPAAAIQAVLIHLIGRGNNIARIIVLVAAVPALIVVQMYFSSQFNLSPFRLWVEAVLRGGAIVLLLTPESAAWFRRARAA